MGNGAAGLTREAVRRLAKQPEGPGPSVAMLLDVDGRRTPARAGARALAREAVPRLANQPEGRGPIVSLLLNVDGRRHPRPQDYQAAFDRLRRGVDATDADATKAMAAVEGVVRARLDRSHVRGL